MILSWMLYGAAISALVAAGASAAEVLGRLNGYPARWIWAGAIALTLALLALAPVRREVALPDRTALPMATDAATNTSTMRAAWPERVWQRVVEGRRVLGTRLGAVARAAGAAPPMVGRLAAGGWITLTTLLIGSLVGGQARIRRARRRWPLTDIYGTRVRIAPDTGPVVIGVRRPEIIVPRWLLARPPHDQRLVIAHEAEHVRALDTLLLAAGYVAIILLPWCPAIWYLFSRLRLAVELDCDARVLRAGAAPRSYGALLIDVAEQNTAFPVGATGLVAGPSHLQRRLMAMKPTAPRFARLRGTAALGLCSLALLAACEAKLPTASDIDALNGSQAQAQAERMSLLKANDPNVEFVVDGAVVSKAQANTYQAIDIASVSIKKGPASGHSRIELTTKPAAGRAAVDSAARPQRDQSVGVTEKLAAEAKRGPAPLIFINGVRSTDAQMKALDRNAIESVEILKGRAAAALYSDSSAAAGVITITTKK